jgi:acyl carrier protein
MTDEVTTALARFIATELLKQPKRSIAPDQPLISSRLIDSLHLVDLAIFVEREFGARIEDTELNAETFDTLEQLAALVRARRC